MLHWGELRLLKIIIDDDDDNFIFPKIKGSRLESRK